MNRGDLRERLRDEPIAAEREAEDRSWELLRAAYEERPLERPGRPVRPRRLAIAIAAAAILAIALALTPAGAEVRDWIEDVIEPGREDARPALTSLPASGQLLVESTRGPWVVQEDGSRRLLGDYEQATWSPSGLYVAVTEGRELLAVNPVGDVRWSDPHLQRVSDPAWAPSGFRIAYRSGDSLRVIAGDGTDDRLIAVRVAPATVAWLPASDAVLEANPSGVGTHRLAYVLPGGRIRLVDVDSGRVLWTTGPGPEPVELHWSSDGERLLALAPSELRMFDRDGELVDRASATRGATFEAAAYSPVGDRYAVVESDSSQAGRVRSEVRLESEQGGGGRVLSENPGRFTDLAWSPDGEWLLVTWRDADQWLFIRPSDERPLGIDNISRQFDPGGRGPSAFPAISGWCCPP